MHTERTSRDADVAIARQVSLGGKPVDVTGNLSANLSVDANISILSIGHPFPEPVLDAQLSLSLGIVGLAHADVIANGTLVGTADVVAFDASRSISDGHTSQGDLYPQAALRWNKGVDNFLAYIQPGVPVGDYDSSMVPITGSWALTRGLIEATNPARGQPFIASDRGDATPLPSAETG
jgi:Putative MetA-pathway of phenol degradation